MFVGHALLAFALAASAAASFGWSKERALLVGVLTGLFAAAPDVDIAYAFVGLATVSVSDALALAGAFWETGNVVHRAVTHSLVVAPVVALAIGLFVRGLRRQSRATQAASLVVAGVLVAASGATSGALGAVVMGLFCLVSLCVASVAARRTDFDAATVAAAALFGFVTHPFGDLFTGEPPTMLYPLDGTLVAERVAFHADPTVHLLTAFGVELATVWAAIAVTLWLTETSVRTVLHPRAALGVGYAASLLILPAPTLDLSYPFVFTVVAVGALGAAPTVRRARDARRLELLERGPALVTGLAAITLAWMAYFVAYLVA